MEVARAHGIGPPKTGQNGLSYVRRNSLGLRLFRQMRNSRRSTRLREEGADQKRTIDSRQGNRRCAVGSQTSSHDP